MTDDRSRRIRERAYEIWQQQGEPHGAHDTHWDQAEREIAQPEDVSGADEEPSAVRREQTDDSTPTPGQAAEALPSAALSEPAATAAPQDPATDGTPARPAAGRDQR